MASNPGQKGDENKLLGPDFASAFNPKSVAVVGASRVSSGDTPGWRNPSGQFIPYLQQLGYRGKIYPVNPKAAEILGLRAYPNLASCYERLGELDLARGTYQRMMEAFPPGTKENEFAVYKLDEL